MCYFVSVPKPEEAEQISEEIAEVKVEIVEKTPEIIEKIEEPAEDVKDAWDASSSDEDESEELSPPKGSVFISKMTYFIFLTKYY